MTFKERRKRADAQKIADDFESIESSFLSFAQKLNKKRQAQLMKRVERVIPVLIKAHEAGDTEEVQGILLSLKMPSSKEWGKGIHKLILTATESGILRAHHELLRLKELYQFDESWKVVDEGYGFEVVLPEEAREFIRERSYEVGVITEDTVIRKIRERLEQGLDEGLPMKDITALVKSTADSWMSDFHAQTIARTETGKYYNAGRLARWLDPEAGGFVEALQYDAIVDTRTTDVCRHLDGRIISITDDATIAEYTPPNHYQCRATWLPVTRYEEWEGDFDTSVGPEKGFNFKSPLPKLLDGAVEPLVKVTPLVDPEGVTDPDVIRTLDDEGFKVAIKNVEDPELKLSLVTERAEQMSIKELDIDTSVKPFSFSAESLNAEEFTFKVKGQSYTGKYTSADHGDVYQLYKEMELARSHSEFNQVIEDFLKRFDGEDSWSKVDLLVTLRSVLKEQADIGKTMKGELKKNTGDALKRAKETFSLKRPPKTANYKRAKDLQSALDEGERWFIEHIDPDILRMPEGKKSQQFKVRFQANNNRAYAIPSEWSIYFGPSEFRPSVVVHEMGHIVHRRNRKAGINDLINAFFVKRTKGLKKDSMNGNEVTIKDDFYDAYVGRIYDDNREGSMGEEVLSMGLQAMYENPAEFYRNDKEHFLLTYAIMKGLF